MTVKVVVPILVNDSNITASDIPEPDASVGEIAWYDRTEVSQIPSIAGKKYDSISVGDYVYFVGDFGSVIKFDVLNKSLTSFGSHSGTVFSMAYGGGDFVYAAGNSGSILKIDITNETTSTFGSGIQNISCLNYHSNGFIYGAGDGSPVTNGEIIKIDTSLDSVSVFGSYDSLRLGMESFSDQFIYCVGGGLDVLKIDVINESITPITSQSLNLQQIVKGNDGNMYCVGDSRVVTKINTIDDTFNYFGNMSEGMRDISVIGDKLYSCSILGGVYQIDYKNNNTKIYRSTTKSLRTISSNGLYLVSGGDDSDLTFIDRGYVDGEEVVYLPNHTKYVCLTSETFSNPSETATGGVDAEWQKIGLSNKWAMFDESVSYSSSIASDKSITVTPGASYDTVGCIGIDGIYSVKLEILDQSNSQLYIETKSTANPDADFSEFKLSEILFTGIPPFIDTKVKLTFYVDSSLDGKIGDVVIGKSYGLGDAVLGTQSNTKDYSEQKEDVFGNFEYIERAIVPSVTYQIDVKKSKSIAVQRFVNSLRGKSNLWYADIGEPEFLTVHGRCETIPMTYENHSIVSYKAKVRGTI